MRIHTIKKLVTFVPVLVIFAFLAMTIFESSTRNSELAIENKKLADVLKQNNEFIKQAIEKNEELDRKLEMQEQKHEDIIQKMKVEERIQAQQPDHIDEIEVKQIVQRKKFEGPDVRPTIRQPDGPGEMGKPVIIDVSKLSAEEKAKYDAGWKRNQYNQYAADMISLDRSLPDFRFEECKTMKWHDPLPTVSVVIIFHNEALSVLLRTAHSVLNRSDPKLLVEIILVDDASTYGNYLLILFY
jgi:hypothetical protein